MPMGWFPHHQWRGRKPLLLAEVSESTKKRTPIRKKIIEIRNETFGCSVLHTSKWLKSDIDVAPGYPCFPSETLGTVCFDIKNKSLMHYMFIRKVYERLEKPDV
eukprot:GEMP01062864.1.p1 GENE.GEMP01062864.1~~GEMP01062864.1.p1  ORF type:complete len:104 (-),score=3.75 GEMP01062864.1:951-1262(-)